MERAELSENILNKLKCSLCDGYLSIPPIMVISETGGDQICGRCQDVPTELKIRNIAYENIAESAIFPCFHQNCDLKLSWPEVEQHESICQEAMIQCPIFRNCEDIYKISNIRDHFSDKHRELLHFDTMVSNIFECNGNISLLMKENSAYLVYSYIGNFFWTAVFTLNPDMGEETKYTLKISTSQSQSSVSILSDEHQIKKYNEREHCARCMFDFGKCPVKFHKNYKQLFSFSQMTTKTNKSAMKHIMNSEFDNILWSISFPERSQATSSNNHGNPVKLYLQNNSNNLLQHLECPICNVYMFKPIFVCETGHTICHVCKPQLESAICPSCRMGFEHSRNYSLEAMADCAEIPCRFENRGCTFIGNTERILVHESNCPYLDQITVSSS